MTLQPVARDGGPAGARIFSDLTQGQRTAASLSSAEHAALMVALTEAEALEAQKLREAASGSIQRQRRAIRSYRTKAAVRFLALHRSVPDHLRSQPEDSYTVVSRKRAERITACVTNLPRLLDLQRRPTGVLVPRAKRGGGFRHTLAFSWTQQALFRALASALTPFVGLHASQFQLLEHDGKRGTRAACEALLAGLNKLGQEADDYVFLELDVENFFGSISETWWSTKPLLDGDIKVQAYMAMDQVVLSRRVRDRVRGASTYSGVQREFPQGSALSALLSEWVMADVLREVPDLPPAVLLFTYCDNVGVLAPAWLIDAIKEHFLAAFSASRAGPFSLREKARSLVTRPFRFLGMEFVVGSGGAVVRPPEATLSGFSISVLSDLMLAAPGEFQSYRAAVKGRAGNWSLWDGCEQWREEMLVRIDDAERVALSRLDPPSAGYRRGGQAASLANEPQLR